MIRVGPAGWSYDDWNGIVYPPNPGRNFDRLEWIAHDFDVAEINTSFYHIPAPRLSKSWVGRIDNPRFLFTAKLHRSFTHDPVLPDEAAARSFRSFLEPLLDAGRLGMLLVQFPWSFRNDHAAQERLRAIAQTFGGIPLAVEVRHSSFDDPGFRDFLAERQITLVDIDQPRHNDSIGPLADLAGDRAYIRFHGRNFEKWFAHDEAWERYDYLYNEQELTPWVQKIEQSPAKDVFVIMNNHFRGQAVVNAIEVKRRLGQPVEISPHLASAYPGRFEPPPGSQDSLFRE